MHSIALCVMMVGGWISPETDIATIPLRDELSTPTAIQEQEWRERLKKHPLPRVPTLDDTPAADNYRTAGGYRPYGFQNNQQGQSNLAMPTAQPIRRDRTWE